MVPPCDEHCRNAFVAMSVKAGLQDRNRLVEKNVPGCVPGRVNKGYRVRRTNYE